MNTTKRRPLRAIALACMVAAIAIRQGALSGHTVVNAYSGVRSGLAAETCSAKRQVGTVDKVVGKVRVKRGRDVVNAKHGTRVNKGDVLTTASGQKISVTVCGGATVYMNENSSAKLNSRTDVTAKRGEVAE